MVLDQIFFPRNRILLFLGEEELRDKRQTDRQIVESQRPKKKSRRSYIDTHEEKQNHKGDPADTKMDPTETDTT